MKNIEHSSLSLNRRQFIRRSFLSSLVSALTIPSLYSRTSFLDDQQQVDWDKIRAQFPITHWNKIYFNSGSAGVMPDPVLDHLLDLVRQMNQIPPYEAWSLWATTRKNNLSRLATMLNVSPNEVELVRNTTEALNMIIYGLPLQAGDQVLYSKNDYPFAINAWKNRAARDGIELTEVDCLLPSSEEEIVAAYQKAMTPKVKIIHCTHITHAQGHILPVAALTKLAHDNGAKIVVDGAHSVGQIPVDLGAIDCDYFATSLHKWLNAPHGTGLLFVKENLIDTLLNHPSSYPSSFDNINKFEHLGTRAFHQEIGVSVALDFHDAIGTQVKHQRLQELKIYWTSKLQRLDNVVFHTNLSSITSAAITTFWIKKTNKNVSKYLNELSDTYNIHAKMVSGEWGSGIRISVNIFTNFSELDQLVNAIRTIATN